MTTVQGMNIGGKAVQAVRLGDLQLWPAAGGGADLSTAKIVWGTDNLLTLDLAGAKVVPYGPAILGTPPVAFPAGVNLRVAPDGAGGVRVQADQTDWDVTVTTGIMASFEPNYGAGIEIPVTAIDQTHLHDERSVQFGSPFTAPANVIGLGSTASAVPANGTHAPWAAIMPYLRNRDTTGQIPSGNMGKPAPVTAAQLAALTDPVVFFTLALGFNGYAPGVTNGVYHMGCLPLDLTVKPALHCQMAVAP